MPFTLAVTRTVNGSEKTLRWPDRPEATRAELEQVIADFHGGRWPTEGTLTLSAGDADAPSWMRSWRWADVKDMWIEEEH